MGAYCYALLLRGNDLGNFDALESCPGTARAHCSCSLGITERGPVRHSGVRRILSGTHAWATWRRPYCQTGSPHHDRSGTWTALLWSSSARTLRNGSLCLCRSTRAMVAGLEGTMANSWLCPRSRIRDLMTVGARAASLARVGSGFVPRLAASISSRASGGASLGGHRSRLWTSRGRRTRTRTPSIAPPSGGSKLAFDRRSRPSRPRPTSKRIVLARRGFERKPSTLTFGRFSRLPRSGGCRGSGPGDLVPNTG